MTDIVFPVTSQTLARDTLRSWSKMAWLADYVQSGFTVSDAGGLNGTLAAGVAHVGGVYISRDVSTALVFTANATNHVFVTLDEANAAGAVAVVVNTTGTAPSTPYVKVAQVVTGASTISSITDKRPLAFWLDNVTLKAQKYLRGLTSAGAVRNLAGVDASDRVMLGDPNAITYLTGNSVINGLGYSLGGAEYKIWHEGNDGPGSTLDADTLDGKQATAFWRKLILRPQAFGYISAMTWVQSGNQFVPPFGFGHGSFANVSTDRTLVEIFFPDADVLEKVVIHISTHTGSGDVDVYIAKNGSSVASTKITIPNGQTGFYTITGPVSVAAGDSICIQFTGGSGGKNLALKSLASYWSG